MSVAREIKINIVNKPKTQNKNTDFISPKRGIKFPKKIDTYAANHYKSDANSEPNSPTYHLLEQEFNPHNVASSPPDAFISLLKQRMDCYFV